MFLELGLQQSYLVCNIPTKQERNRWRQQSRIHTQNYQDYIQSLVLMQLKKIGLQSPT